MNSAQELKEEINQRVNFIVYDCDTFLMVRSIDQSQISKWKTGGGNFLMVLGLFSTLIFLAKTYRYLTDPGEFVSKDDLQMVNKALKELKKYQEFKEVMSKNKTSFKPPILGQVNEVESFVKLIEASRKKIDLGLPNDNGISARKVWLALRNSLVHMVFPKMPVGTYGNLTSESLQEAIFLVKNGPKAFYIQNNALTCNADKLTVNVFEIKEWLCREVDKFDDAVIKGTLDWMKS